jgi:hypothetical protein
MAYETPILLIVFNRPKKTQLIFDIIKKIKPKKLFISADGPRIDKVRDTFLCDEVKSIINKVDWDCEHEIKISNTNLGCKTNVVDSIDWFFSNVENGVILEDDCIPSFSFFTFCESLLNKYKNNENIMQINGFNGGINYNSLTKNSYYFSKMNHTWGWASWKRAWDKFDKNFLNYEELILKKNIRKYYIDKSISAWMKVYFDKSYSKEDNIWSSNWAFSILKENGLCITPSKNFVRNIGFDEESTSGKSEIFKKFSNISELELDEIIHPNAIKHNLKFDQILFNQVIKKIDPRASKFYYLVNIIKNYFK